MGNGRSQPHIDFAYASSRQNERLRVQLGGVESDMPVDGDDGDTGQPTSHRTVIGLR